MLAAFIVTAGTYVYYERINVQHKTIRVGSGADAFYAQDQGAVANQILAALDRTSARCHCRRRPAGGDVELPAARPNSIPYIVQMPPEMIIYSQDRVLESVRKSPPDYVVYLEGDVSEYGVGGYSADFGANVFSCIIDGYDPIAGDSNDPKWVLFKRRSKVP